MEPSIETRVHAGTQDRKGLVVDAFLEHPMQHVVGYEHMRDAVSCAKIEGIDDTKPRGHDQCCLGSQRRHDLHEAEHAAEREKLQIDAAVRRHVQKACHVEGMTGDSALGMDGKLWR